MGDHVAAYTPTMRKGAGHVADHAPDIERIITALQSANSAHWNTFGTDDIGKNLTEGEHGYRASQENLFNVLKSNVSRLQSYSGTYIDGANALDDTDYDNGTTFST